jgi:thioredoxin 1
MSSFYEMIGCSKPVLVDFHAEWCGPCKLLKPVLEQLKRRLGDEVSIIKVDVDRNPAASAAYQVQAVPTLIFFRKGKVQWRHSGIIEASQLEQIIRQHI